MKVYFSKRSIKDLNQIGKGHRDLILHKIFTFQEDPHSVKLKKLKGHTNQYRIRIGNFRVRMEINWLNGQAEIKRIKLRKDVYKD